MRRSGGVTREYCLLDCQVGGIELLGSSSPRSFRVLQSPTENRVLSEINSGPISRAPRRRKQPILTEIGTSPTSFGSRKRETDAPAHAFHRHWNSLESGSRKPVRFDGRILQ